MHGKHTKDLDLRTFCMFWVCFCTFWGRFACFGFLSVIFCMFLAHGKNAEMLKKLGRDVFSPTNQDPTIMLSRTEFHSDDVIFCF